MAMATHLSAARLLASQFPLTLPSSSSSHHPRIVFVAAQCSQNENVISTPDNGTSRRHLIMAAPILQMAMVSNAFALLEGDDDEVLLEKVKEDRQKKLQMRGVLKSFKKETDSLQSAVYKLSKVGRAIDEGDFTTASTLLGTSLDEDWINQTTSALSKVSMTSEETDEVEKFNKALSALQLAVSKKDLDSSKDTFVASTTIFEKWSNLTGLAFAIKGL